jgi:hypothetical protein
VGAHVYLFAANTTGYGGNGIAASSSNASVSLLTNTAGTTLDTSGGATNGDYYVGTSGVTVSCPSGGCFTITGDYTCAAGAQVYLYALGGNAGGGTNAAAGLMAALGSCPMAGNFAAATPYIVVNEVSTVAAAYAMAGFATDATHVSSSGTALAQVGIANAFANAGNLETLATGVALATTPAGNGTVPQAEINTLANILAACVNSTGAVTGPTNPTACYTLFTNAESAGSSGTAPSDTATAAINLAHNPGSNIASLYALGSATPPFAPALSAQPNDFTVAVQYATNLSDKQTTSNGSVALAVDQNDNLWIANVTQNNVEEISNQGVPYPYSPMTNICSTCNSIANPSGLAIDEHGNAWVGGDMVFSLCASSGAQCSSSYTATANPTYEDVNVNFTGIAGGLAFDANQNLWVTNLNSGGTIPDYSLVELAGVGASASGTTSYEDYQLARKPRGVAVDASGNVWHVDSYFDSLIEISPVGTLLASVTTAPAPTALAIDQTGYVWVAATGESPLSRFSSGGVLLSGSSGYSYGFLFGPRGIAVDGSNRIWVTSSNSGTINSLGEFSATGTYIGPSTNTGYESSGLLGPSGVAIDESGDIWVASEIPSSIPGTSYYGAITEFVGLATPVRAPLSAGLASGQIAPEP